MLTTNSDSKNPNLVTVLPLPTDPKGSGTSHIGSDSPLLKVNSSEVKVSYLKYLSKQSDLRLPNESNHLKDILEWSQLDAANGLITDLLSGKGKNDKAVLKLIQQRGLNYDTLVNKFDLKDFLNKSGINNQTDLDSKEIKYKGIKEAIKNSQVDSVQKEIASQLITKQRELSKLEYVTAPKISDRTPSIPNSSEIEFKLKDRKSSSTSCKKKIGNSFHSLREKLSELPNKLPFHRSENLDSKQTERQISKNDYKPLIEPTPLQQKLSGKDSFDVVDLSDSSISDTVSESDHTHTEIEINKESVTEDILINPFDELSVDEPEKETTWQKVKKFLGNLIPSFNSKPKPKHEQLYSNMEKGIGVEKEDEEIDLEPSESENSSTDHVSIPYTMLPNDEDFDIEENESPLTQRKLTPNLQKLLDSAEDYLSDNEDNYIDLLDKTETLKEKLKAGIKENKINPNFKQTVETNLEAYQKILKKYETIQELVNQAKSDDIKTRNNAIKELAEFRKI